MSIMRRVGMTALLALTALWGAIAAEGGALTNADVVKMTKAGLSTDLIIAKIDQAASVDFKLETDDIIALKEAGVKQDVIERMLRRVSGPPPSARVSMNDSGMPDVTLTSTSGTTTLKPVEGDHKQFAAPFVGMKHFLEFDGEQSETRIKDVKPTLTLPYDGNPKSRWWLVKLDPDDDDPTRGLDLESMGMWGGAHTFEPDEEFIIGSTLTEAKPGVWQFVPNKPLKPGEYALYSVKGFIYDFGVDK